MYFVDKEKLTQKLTYLQGLTEDYDKNKENHYAYERIAQMLIESSVDIGNMIIDGFILRDPGNYKDVIDILELENVISKETQTHINDTVDVRKQFAHNYTELNVKDGLYCCEDNIEVLLKKLLDDEYKDLTIYN